VARERGASVKESLQVRRRGQQPHVIKPWPTNPFCFAVSQCAPINGVSDHVVAVMWQGAAEAFREEYEEGKDKAKVCLPSLCTPMCLCQLQFSP
jgi:hypothetical protein